MVAPLKSVLLATNLKDYNQVAFDVAVSIATHYQAKLILLHVMEKVSEQNMLRIESMLGINFSDNIQKAEEEEARKKMTGKNISSAVIKDALENYCKNVGIDTDSPGTLSREVIVTEGDVVENTLKYAKEFGCGMIVIGSHEGLFSKSVVSGTIKGLLKNSDIPVLTVPHAFEK